MAAYSDSKAFLWALTGILAAFHLVMTLLPLFILTSGGGFISIGVISAVVIGYIAGPFYGVASVIIGSTLGVAFLNVGGIVGYLVPIIAPAASAFVAGCMRERMYIHVIIIYVTGLVLFLVGPIGSMAYPYLWMHITALALVMLMLVPRIESAFSEGLRLRDDKPEMSILPSAILAYAALMADHLTGGALASYHFVYILGWDPGATAVIFVLGMFTYALERLALTLVAAGVILALAKSLNRLSPMAEK